MVQYVARLDLSKLSDSESRVLRLRGFIKSCAYWSSLHVSNNLVCLVLSKLRFLLEMMNDLYEGGNEAISVSLDISVLHFNRR